MDQYRSVAEQFATMDLIPLPISHNPVVSRAKLSADILLLVLELILAQKYPQRPFSDMRSISRQFHRLTTPLSYRHIVLNNNVVQSLISEGSTLAPHKLQVARDVREYTRHVILKGNFLEEDLKIVFESLKYLRDVTVGWPESVWPSSLDLICRRPRLRLSIMRQELDLTTKQYLTKLDPLQLVSCKIIQYSDGPDMLEFGSPLKEFLLGKENLEILHLACRGYDDAVPDDAIRSYERMPAVKELVLCGYSWNHSPTTAVRFWNWSRITHLELRRVPIVPFLATVTPEHLVNLRTFKTDGCCPDDFSMVEGCYLLCGLLCGIKALENLSMSLNFEGEDLKAKLVRAISHHRTSLRSLEFGEQRNMNCTLFHIPSHPTQINHVAALKLWLTNVVELSLDNATIQAEKQLYLSPISDVQNAGDTDYATILAGFRNLRRLTICMRPRDSRKVHCKESMIQATQAAARAWLVRLLERKKGARFESIVVRLEIFCDPSRGRHNILQSRVARLSYRYDGALPFQEYLVKER